MKHFLIALLIHCSVLFLGLLIDYILYYYDIVDALPFYFYYLFGCISAAIYATVVTSKIKRNK